MYQIKDISVVIPTYQRASEVEATLRSLAPLAGKLQEVIIVDQSKDGSTKKLISKFNGKNIKYLFSKTPSITIARNLGVAHSSLKSKVICFLDDDVDINRNYFLKIIEMFNKNHEALAVAGVDDTSYTGKNKHGKFYRLMSKIFFLGHFEKDEARVISSYGNTYPLNLQKVINAEWIPGLNMAYKKEVFKEQQFDENLLGYTVAEDIDFSYNLNRRRPGSIFITPYAHLVHRASKLSRNPTKRLAYINQVDHFYFNFKNLNRTLKEKLVFVWSLLGIALLRIGDFVVRQDQMTKLKLAYFFESLLYCINNLEKIREGKLREFDKIV